jgi:general secretion pathway protein D
VNKDTGVIVVTGTMKQLRAVDNFIKNLMKSMKKEVLIDVKIYSVELSKSHKTGIDWSQLSLSLPNSSTPLRAENVFGSNSIFKAAQFNAGALLNFLAQNGNVNSISNPKIMTLNNQKAIISVGDTIYYKYASKVVTDQNGNPQTQYTIGSKFVGVILDITPQISDTGEIILSISPRISAFRDLAQISTNTVRDMPPDTKDNTMQSVIKIKDGDTIVLGGLISDDKSLKVNGVPILKEIPLVKYLFSSRETISNKKEIVFVITPHIINLNKKRTLRDLGFGKFK